MKERLIKLLKSFLISMLVLSGAQTLLGVNNRVDSLKTLLKSESNDSVKVCLYRELGDEFLYNSHADALEYYTHSKELALALQDSDKLAEAYIGICDVYSILGHYQKAISNINEAKKYVVPNSQLDAFCYNRMAIEYYNLGDTVQAIQNDYESLRINKLINDSISIAYDYNNIGSYYYDLENYSEAEKFYHLSLQYAQDADDLINAYTYRSLGALSKTNGYHDLALTYFFEARKVIQKQADVTYELAVIDFKIAQTYLENNSLSKAELYLNKSLASARALNNFDLLRQNYKLQSKLFEQKKMYKEALLSSQTAYAYSDTITQSNKQNILNTLKNKHDLLENEIKLEASRQQNSLLEKQKLRLQLFSAVIAALLVGVIAVIYLMRKEHQENRKLIAKLDKANQSVTQMLSIIGHDLKSSVGNLKCFTELMHTRLLDKQAIVKLVEQFVPMVNATYSMLDNLLVWSKNKSDLYSPNFQSVFVADIVHETLLYLDHQLKIKNITLDHIESDVVLRADRNMISAVIRNILSNAIKFSDIGSTIAVQCYYEGSEVVFEIIDSGIGMSKEQIDTILSGRESDISKGTNGEQGSGLGLSLCHTFIKRHKGYFKIDSEVGVGSTFSFVLPRRG